MTSLPPPPTHPSVSVLSESEGAPTGPTDPSRAYGPETLAQVLALLPIHGPAETSRRTGLSYPDVLHIARAHPAASPLNTPTTDGVEEARTRIQQRHQTQDLRRHELREALLLAAERAVTRVIHEIDAGSPTLARDAANVMKLAYAELRLEYGEAVPDDSQQRAEEERQDQLRARALAIRDELADRRKASATTSHQKNPRPQLPVPIPIPATKQSAESSTEETASTP